MSTSAHPTFSPRVFFPLIAPLPPTSTLFPYTTLFRSALRTHEKVVVMEQTNFRHSLLTDFKQGQPDLATIDEIRDRKSTRLNSSHVAISYAVFCLKKKTNQDDIRLDRDECTTTLTAV